MIEGIRYYPLIECDTDAHKFMSLFVASDESAVRRSHSLYLEECVHGYYRLRTGKVDALPNIGMTIACPACGSRLENITAGKHKPRQALYVCRSCNH